MQGAHYLGVSPLELSEKVGGPRVTVRFGGYSHSRNELSASPAVALFVQTTNHVAREYN